MGAWRFEDQVLVPCPLVKDLIFHVLAHMKYHRKMAMFISFYIYVDIYVWLLNVFGCDGFLFKLGLYARKHIKPYIKRIQHNEFVLSSIRCDMVKYKVYIYRLLGKLLS